MFLITPAKCRAARAALNMTQRQLSVAANVSHGTITRYEADRGLPVRNNLFALEKALEAAGITFHGSGIEWFAPEDERVSASEGIIGDGTPQRPYSLEELHARKISENSGQAESAGQVLEGSEDYRG